MSIQNSGNRKFCGELPAIPDRLYFTIGEASSLSLVKPHVLRYWEKEFATVLSPGKRRGGRRYYTRKDLLIIRQIRELLYEQGYTIEGAKTKLKSVTGSGYGPINGQFTKKLILELKEILEVLEK